MAPASNTNPTSSKGAAMVRSSAPSLLKSLPARVDPKKSLGSATPAIPPVPWKKTWSPVTDRSAAEPYRTLMPPASNLVPTSSKGTPMAMSPNPSLLKSPLVSAKPNSSPISAVPSTPPTPWRNCWLPAALSPPAEPYRTLTAPACVRAPSPSEGTPTARSAKPSLSKSPTPRSAPKPSPASAVPSTPAVSWEKNWPPPAARPLADPYRTLTAPASVIVPTSSPGTPMARSPKPSLLKSPAAKALPKKSNGSGVVRAADALSRHPDGEVREAIVVEVGFHRHRRRGRGGGVAVGGPAFGLGSGRAGDHRPARQRRHDGQVGQGSTHVHHPRRSLVREGEIGPCGRKSPEPSTDGRERRMIPPDRSRAEQVSRSAQEGDCHAALGPRSGSNPRAGPRGTKRPGR